VRLASQCRIDFGRLLAAQDEQPDLDLGVVLARRRTRGPISEAVQAALGKALVPQEDGVFGQTHVLGDSGIGLTSGDPPDDLGTAGILLRRGAGDQRGSASSGDADSLKRFLSMAPGERPRPRPFDR
jgi:hypothetical protein